MAYIGNHVKYNFGDPSLKESKNRENNRNVNTQIFLKE